MNVYLVGFMGTGKSTVGKALAARKGWQFVDLDELIEMRAGTAITDIFARQGEAAFRRLEKKALKEVSREDRFIVACGGGIVMDEENIRVMKGSGRMVCLAASAEAILKRTAGQTHRPLLNVENPREKIDLLLKLRQPYYAQAHITVDTSRLSPEKVAEKVLAALEKERVPRRKQ